MTRARTIHYCNACDYKTDRKYDRDKHVTRMHGSNVQQNASQAHEIGFNITQESIQHTYPNEDYNVNNIQNQDNSQYGTGSTVIPVEKYKEVVGIAHEWKKQCENLQQEKCADESWIKQQDAEILNLRNKLQEICNANKNWEEAYRLLQEKQQGRW